MRIIPRSEWTDRANTADRVALPYKEAVIHTEAGAILPGDWDVLAELATTLSLTEREHVRSVDRYHRVTRGWDDGIGYNFFITRDGSIIEGRGWGRRGAHTQEGRNTTAVGICFAGHGDLQEATEAQWLAAEWLIGEGVRIGALVPNPIITGHRNYAQKSCPGNLVYPHLERLRGIRGPVNHVQEDNFMAISDERFEKLEDRTERVERLLDDIHGEVMVKVEGKTRLDRMAAWGDTLATIKDVVVKIARFLGVPKV